MKDRGRAWLDAVLRWSPAQSIYHRRASDRLAVLAYHGVDDPGRFEQHLDRVRQGAAAVSLDDVLAAFSGGRSLPDRAVLITFDDGHRSVLELAMPLLMERGMPAVAFVVAGVVDSDRPFWWTEVIDLAGNGGVVDEMAGLDPADLVRALKRVPDDRRRAAIAELGRTASAPAAPLPQLTSADLRTLESAGIAIGNHTWGHPCLSRCDAGTCRAEIEEAHRMLSNVLGHEPRSFAYPDGDRDDRAAVVLRELGYEAAFLFDHRLSPRRPADTMAVSRLRVNSTTTLDRFDTIASGLHPSLHRVRGGV
ncbi:MAG TPA: polysaccharide deacetylase family protein [Actinomycetota bacterium]